MLYPTTNGAPQDEGYNWFVANEKGKKLALPPLAAEQAPTLPVDPGQQAGQGRRKELWE